MAFEFQPEMARALDELGERYIRPAVEAADAAFREWAASRIVCEWSPMPPKKGKILKPPKKQLAAAKRRILKRIGCMDLVNHPAFTSGAAIQNRYLNPPKKGEC